jgi:hypothetical protein
MSKSEREHVKDFVSRTTDEARLSYGVKKTAKKRRFIFVGTVNPERKMINVLEEDRRYLIIPVSKRFDYDRVKSERLQILAEAKEIERTYGDKLIIPVKLHPEARAVRASVVALDANEVTIREALERYVSAKIEGNDVYAFIGLKDQGAIGRYVTVAGGIAPIMEKLGWTYGQIRKKGKPVRAYTKGDGAGWLRATWPYGNLAAAVIGVDEDASPDWKPEFLGDKPDSQEGA